MLGYFVKGLYTNRGRLLWGYITHLEYCVEIRNSVDTDFLNKILFINILFLSCHAVFISEVTVLFLCLKT